MTITRAGGITVPNQKQPVNLVDYKGRKHLTKAEKAERVSSEIHAPADNIVAPKYLNKKQQDEFYELSGELEQLDIMSNLDTGELARYVVAHSLYQRYTKLMRQLPAKKAKRMRREAEAEGKPIPKDVTDEELALELEDELSSLQARYFDQCEKCARALGLNITSRCRLVIPKAPAAPPTNKFSRFEKGEQTG